MANDIEQENRILALLKDVQDVYAKDVQAQRRVIAVLKDVLSTLQEQTRILTAAFPKVEKKPE